MRYLFGALVALAVLLPMAAEPGDAMVKPLTIQELANGSTLVVRGHVMDKYADWTTDSLGNRITTDFTVRVSEILVGDLPGSANGEVRVRCEGGQIGNIIVRAHEEARIEGGEEVVLFLVDHPSAPGCYKVYGWFQGKLTVLDGRVREMRDMRYRSLRRDILEARLDGSKKK